VAKLSVEALPKKSIKGNWNKHYLSGQEGWLAAAPLHCQIA